MEINILEHGSPAWQQMVDLRMEILRLPLGLTFTAKQLENEKNDILIGAFENDRIIGCCILTPHDSGTIQLRQMVVQQGIQHKGVGRQIIAFAEKTALEKGYQVLMMHARDTALEFYRKCGYETEGGQFIEVTVPHHCMKKKLV